MIFPLSSLFKQLFICPQKERTALNISPSLLKQAKLGNSYAQLEIGGRYFSSIKEEYVKKSIYWFTLSAKNNNKEAMFTLGTLYFRGKNISQDLQKSIFWYKKAAALGHEKAIKMLNQIRPPVSQQENIQQEDGEALFQLANNYCINNELTCIDYENIKVLYEKAANLGNIKALINLASLYENGLGTTKDQKKAAQLYLQAAEKENDTAMLNIGILYLIGEGVEKNTEKGIHWLLKASQQGNSKASFNLGVLYYEQQNITQALEFFTIAANSGHIEAMFNLGLIYQTDDSISDNIKNATDWFKKASLLGHKKATQHLNIHRLEQLATKAENGNRKAIKEYIDTCASLHIKIDNHRLIDWLHKSADLGDNEAMVDIGNFYLNGTPPLTNDFQQAIYWFTKASHLNNHQAMNLLGLIYLNGNGVTANQQTAIEWFKRAASFGNDKAMVNIANIYLENATSDSDYQLAFQWLSKAAQEHNQEAIQSIVHFYTNGLGIPKDLEKAMYWQQKLIHNPSQHNL